MHKQEGFTLLELILSIMIMAVISVVMGRVLFQGYNTMLTSENISTAGWQGLIALERMTNDIHTIRSAADISTISASQFAFTDVSGNSVQFQLSGSTLLRNSATLASGVQSLTFTYLDKNGSVTGTAANVRYILMAMTITQGTMTLAMSTMAGTRGMI